MAAHNPVVLLLLDQAAKWSVGPCSWMLVWSGLLCEIMGLLRCSQLRNTSASRCSIYPISDFSSLLFIYSMYPGKLTSTTCHHTTIGSDNLRTIVEERGKYYATIRARICSFMLWMKEGGRRTSYARCHVRPQSPPHATVCTVCLERYAISHFPVAIH